jgi:hypothetical protein
MPALYFKHFFQFFQFRAVVSESVLHYVIFSDKAELTLVVPTRKGFMENGKILY